jgi:hypothetical protein
MNHPQYIALCNDRQQVILEPASGKSLLWRGSRWLLEVDRHEVALLPADESSPVAPGECEAVLNELTFVHLPPPECPPRYQRSRPTPSAVRQVTGRPAFSPAEPENEITADGPGAPGMPANFPCAS